MNYTTFASQHKENLAASISAENSKCRIHVGCGYSEIRRLAYEGSIQSLVFKVALCAIFIATVEL